MQDQAARLAQVVGRFRLAESMVAAAPAARAMVHAPVAPAPKRIARPAPAAAQRASVRKPAVSTTGTEWETF
jgi:hypothetical protein